MNLEHLSPSAIAMYLRCPKQWYFRYIEGLSVPPAAAAFTGSRAHDASAAALTPLLTGGALLPADTTLDAYDTFFEKGSQDEDVEWGDGTAGEWKDKGVKALKSHHPAILANTAPIALEAKLERPIPDTPYTLLGFVDVVEADALRDHKFGARLKSQTDADQSMQLSAYAWLNEKAGEVSLDSSSFAGKSSRIISARTPAQITFYLENTLIPVALSIADAVEKGRFPCHTEGWHCGAQWCGFFDRCVGKGA